MLISFLEEDFNRFGKLFYNIVTQFVLGEDGKVRFRPDADDASKIRKPVHMIL